MKLASNESFIEKANKTHSNKYDYSKVVYVKSLSKVNIICPDHGSFFQRPDSHVNGNGCPKCKSESYKANFRSTIEEFVNKAKQIHGDKYDYSEVVYINSQHKVKILCKDHGPFFQRPAFHVFGKGCAQCYGNVKPTTEQYIDKCRKIHGSRYDYSKVNYTGNKNKVTIICPDHGDFDQLAQDHTRGVGCLRCKESKGEKFIANVLDKNHIRYVREYGLPNYNYKYDFYLPDENLFIEFHGSQHYYAVDYFGGEEGLKKTQFRDAFKKNLAREYRIPLIEFNYRHIATLSSEEFEKVILENIQRERRLRRT